jgi:hypothetical protein
VKAGLEQKDVIVSVSDKASKKRRSSLAEGWLITAWRWGDGGPPERGMF